MAINAPGDILLDVIRAADPAAAGKAEAMLEAAATARARNAAQTGAFAELASTKPAQNLRDSLPVANAGKTVVPEAYRKFEGMVLQQFIQQMLPDGNEEFFGEGTAGDIWKSMLAEQIGTVIASAGGIGIAERMLADTMGQRVRPEDLEQLGSNKENEAASLVYGIEREILGKLGNPVETGQRGQTSFPALRG